MFQISRFKRAVLESDNMLTIYTNFRFDNLNTKEGTCEYIEKFKVMMKGCLSLFGTSWLLI